MRYAEVAVNSPGGRSTFCYTIPPHMEVGIGFAVWVPFGSRVVQGIVVQQNNQPSVETTKEIAQCINGHPLLLPWQIELARWISQYYLSSLYNALALMLPPAFSRKPIDYFQAVESVPDMTSLTPEQNKLLQFIMQRGKVNSKKLGVEFGNNNAQRLSEQLLSYHLIKRDYKIPQIGTGPKQLAYVSLVVSKDKAETELYRLSHARAPKQLAVLEFLLQQTCAISLEELKKSLNCSLGTIRAMERRQILSIEMVNVRRDPLSHLKTTAVLPPVLASSQRIVWEQMEADWDSRDNSAPLVFLLFGVTGSGKTEIYLKALDKVVANGRRGICLVPEIALTPQTVERFAGRYPGRVGILHSNLSPGEQYDEWQWIKEGNCDVVIGPRSALFAPQPDLGLIILDEEHGQMYKQQDRSPRYHAREVAIRLAQLNDAVVILGSATPDVTSFHKAQLGKYKLVTLTRRITSHDHTQMATRAGELSSPPVTYSTQAAVDIVDMRKELKAGNTSLLSRPLLAEMRKTLEQNDQIILFLNRRGTATFVRCPGCGFVFRCPRCSVALTYHSQKGRLICHHCRYSVSIPGSCPSCSDTRLMFLGIGTQKVADEVRRAFPTAKLLRWDSDVTGQRYKHEELLTDFRAHKADILIGTQMIAKGLDLPQVTLAGIISADTSINLPDYCAGEHTFQLLCQVAGRAGRGFKAGKVIIQTFSPENYAIQAVARHDYLGFYRYEINYRRQHNYPPFSHLIRLVYSHTNNELCQQEIKKLSQSLISKIQTMDEDKLSLIGPVPAFVHRVRGRYRWQLIIRGHNPASLLSGITLSTGWTIDVDPVGVT